MVTITEGAAVEINKLLEKESKSGGMLRIFVSDGGCSGFQYGMSITNELMAGDKTYASSGVKVVIDPRSAIYLEGSEVDYVDDLMGGGFKIENPNAGSTCGCGGSFTPEEGIPDELEPAAAGSYGSETN